ncbi:MAG: pantoate--beta-alanine ligase [Thermoanaerobaculia bacterium]
MKIVQTSGELEELRGRARESGRRIAFVPTMGALHEGHLSLVRIAREEAGRDGIVAVSIFVNPTQFAPHEDFDRYPRPVERDRELLAQAGVDWLFLPARETVYPPGFGTWIEPQGAARGLETDFRPHFFRGVATVVARLFALVGPDLAVFGEKDAQQLAVVRQLVRDLGLPLRIVGGPILREPDGLAMSSRNAYLPPALRAKAPRLRAALAEVEASFAAGERTSSVLRQRVVDALAGDEEFTLQYVEVVDPDTFEPLVEVGPGAVVALAANLGATRLIDNVRLGAPAP